MPHPVDVHVGKRLRLRRNMLGISQEDLGKSVGITSQQVQKYERGINRISCSRLFEFSTILNTAVDYFFENIAGGAAALELTDDSAIYGTEDSVMSKRETADLIGTYYKITDKKTRQNVMSIMKVMASQASADAS